MLREGALLYLWALCLSVGHSQPVSCKDGDHCAQGYYCDMEAEQCKECLKCQDYKREPLLIDNTCITSIDKCGACFKGYVIDRLGDVNAPCVMSGSTESTDTPNYVWWLIGISVIVFLSLMIGIIVYIVLNPGVFKFGGNCPSGTVSTNILTAPRASAPEAPPPYGPPTYNNVPYTSVRTESPCPPNHEAGDMNGEYGPFIKPTSPLQRSGPRVSASNEGATVYERPAYDRHEPPSYDATSPVITEVNDNLPIHSEVTADSDWTPNGPSNEDTNVNASGTGGTGGAGVPAVASGAAVPAASGALSAQLAAARRTTLIEPASKRLRRDSPSPTENEESDSSGDNNRGNFSGAHNGVPYKFITQITNVVQFNQTS